MSTKNETLLNLSFALAYAIISHNTSKILINEAQCLKQFSKHKNMEQNIFRRGVGVRTAFIDTITQILCQGKCY